ITPSKAPSVQYCPATLTPSFSAAALNAAARSQVSRTALIPCSVKCRVVMKVAIFPSPATWLAPGGHFIPATEPRRPVATAKGRPGPGNARRLRGRAAAGQGAGKPHRGSGQDGLGGVHDPPAGGPGGGSQGPGSCFTVQ